MPEAADRVTAEQERLRALHRYQILDTPREEEFDGIALLAAEICGTAIAVVNLIGDGRQFFKAEIGLGVRETPLESAFCRQALLEQDFLSVPDATQDPRFADNPLVTGGPGLRFYAGALLKTPDGLPIGTVCVLDTVPRTLSERQQASLRHLARQTMTQLELRRTLREQRAERELQDRILDSATDYAIVATDRHGRITRWNEGAVRILGWTASEMLGRPAATVFTPEDRAGGQPEIEMNLALARGRAPAERWYLRKSGERFWAQGETMPLTAEDGTTQGFLKILRDRSQHRAQAAARDADERRFRSLVEVSPQVVWFGDADGTVTYCNAYWFDYTGLPPGDTGEASWTSAIHPDHRERIRAAWFAAARSGTRFEMEFPLRRADGEYRWFLSRGRPVADGDGRILSWIGIALDIHERKRAEGRFQVLTTLSPATIWFGDPDGGVSYVNDRWYEYSGQTPDEALPVGWAEAVHPDDRPALMAAWDEARARGTPYDTEARLRRRDGAYRWFSLRAAPLRDEAGTVVGWLGSNSDIHDRRRTEEDLRKTQDLLRLATEATSLGIFDYNLATGDVHWDAPMRAAFGLPLDAPVSYATFLAGLHPEDRARTDAAVQAALDPAGPGRFDIEYRTVGLADGIERWLAAKGRTIVEQGRAMRFVGTARDITAGRRADRELRETEERYRLAAQATNDAIWDWDLTSDHIRWNEAVQTLFGYAAAEVGPSGAWWKAQIHPDDRVRVTAGIHAVIDGTGEHWNDEYRFLRADGTYADILDRGYVLRDGRGRAMRMIGAMLDITARKRAEEHQRLLTGELQHRVKNTLALVQAIASQTLRGARDVDEMREAFASRLISLGRAHDILTQASWTAAPILDVVEGALSVHQPAGPVRIRMSGPNVRLAAKPALSLALALHELATNAFKYGALSNETGLVDVRWHVVHGAGETRFSLTWSEQGGPPILTPPQRKGFGSRLIERSFAAEVDGEVTLTYAPAGLVCRLEAALSSMQEQRSEAAA
ncbi:PAS domain-containing protein [Methylobacterium sp. DB0501]|nr:PAS domain-containing protein [Methylobacterium sp. DB0501]